MFKAEISNYVTYLENGHKAEELMKKCPELKKRAIHLCLGDLTIEAEDFDDLHEIRKSLRQYFKTWEDELVSKYIGGNSFNVKYKSKDVKWIEITMTFPREKVPQELLGNCIIKGKIIPDSAEYTTYDVVCPL